MRQVANYLLMICLVIGVAGCDSRTDRTDGGGVLLSISDFDGLPILVNVNATRELAGCLVQVEEIVVQNVPKNPVGNVSDLMNVEIQSYEVKYSRGDRGTRVPTPYVRGLFGVAVAGATFAIENLPVMSCDQLETTPLSDLLFVNGAIDSETGQDRIVLNFSLRFFGRTLSGDAVETAPAFFTIEFIP
jgi:hypothetical protein